jgi:hypothetical protein
MTCDLINKFLNLLSSNYFSVTICKIIAKFFIKDLMLIIINSENLLKNFYYTNDKIKSKLTHEMLMYFFRCLLV